jgi:hypothetical protein
LAPIHHLLRAHYTHQASGRSRDFVGSKWATQDSCFTERWDLP